MTRRRARENLAAVTPDQWEAARERERVFRPLIRDGGWPGGGEVANAARQLGISVQWARSLLRRFIADPRISTLLPDKGGGRRVSRFWTAGSRQSLPSGSGRTTRPRSARRSACSSKP